MKKFPKAARGKDTKKGSGRCSSNAQTLDDDLIEWVLRQRSAGAMRLKRSSRAVIVATVIFLYHSGYNSRYQQDPAS